MSTGAATKVTAGHLARSAYLYVRQSTLRQVLTNTESTECRLTGEAVQRNVVVEVGQRARVR